MEVFKKIGSKERFYEIMSGVNKIKLNEDAMGSEGGLADKAVQELLSGSLDIEQINNQVNGGESTVEIVGKDDIGSKFIFKFIVSSNETDQQGVNVINDADIIELVGDMPKYDAKFQMDKNDSVVAEINKNYKEQLIDAISEYVEFESDAESVADEMYEEAVRLIDKVPYNKGSEEIQTQKAYADQKPVNPDVRVHSNELDKYVSEEDDDFALPPDYSPEDMPKPQDSDDGSVSLDPYEQEPQYDDGEEATPEDKELYSRAYDNITASGNQFPTSDQIEKEVLKLKGLDKPVEKTRTIPRGAEEFWEGHVVTDIKADDVVKQSYDSLSDEKKKQLIFDAQELVDEALGSFKDKLPRQEYVKNVQKEAVKLYKEAIRGMNEDEKKSDYPDQMGKTFKPKSQIPKKKKKPQSVVKLKEDDIPEPAIEPDFDAMGMEQEDQLSGGLGDDKSPNQFDPDQVAKGVKVEMEHTDNPLLAMEIALDHLTEDPEYYGGAGDDPEEMAQTNASLDAEEQENDELTDELLGFKPHNVNDYANEEFDYAAQERNYWDK